MGRRLVIFILSAILSACGSSDSNENLSLIERTALKWPQDYQNLGAPEGFIPPEKPKSLKDCITDSVIPEKGLRYIAYPAKYEAWDRWTKSGNHSPKYGRMWRIVEPALTLEIILGSNEDNIKIAQEDLCQEIK